MSTLLILQEGGILAMPDGRPLPAANYRDPVKPLRRTLKQLGKGNITNGMIYQNLLLQPPEGHPGNRCMSSAFLQSYCGNLNPML